MNHKLDFKCCPDCESKDITVYMGSFLCLDCNFTISSEVGYHPEKIIELKKVLSKKGINDEFAEIILKDNTIPFEKRYKLLDKYKDGTKKDKRVIIDMMKSYKSNIEGIIGETVCINKEDLRNKRKDADTFFRNFGAVNMAEFFENNSFIQAIGRDEEILKVANILKSKEKSCALIVGPSGSGISNLALSVVYKIVQQEITGFKDCPVYKIDTAFINTGNVSGDLERSIKDIVLNCRNADAVLLFDDCEQLAEQGISRGTNLDVCDRLSTAIDGLKIIFSTSEEKFAEKLSQKISFLRKTEMVKIDELDIESTKKIMQAFSDKMLFENKTKFTNNIIENIAELSENIKNRNLPDRSLSLMEKVSLNCKPSTKYTIHDICREDIIHTLSKNFKVRTLEDPDYRKKLIELPSLLKTVIKGQDKAIEKICNELLVRDFRRADNSNRPSVFYATGPTGVGKTEMAKKIAEFLTNDKNAYFRIDMSQYNDYSKLNLLTGSTHASDQDSSFVKWVKNYPSGVLVLDEFEKAAPIIQQIFLPIFDQGNMTTPRGPLFFNNMIIFITSNAVIKTPGNFGFVNTNALQLDFNEELAKHIPAELINRIQCVVFFESLSIEHCSEIVTKICAETSVTFKRKGIQLHFSPEVASWVAEKGYSPKFNARELDRAFDKLVLIKLSKFFFETDSKKWNIEIIEDNLIVTTF